MQKSMQIKEILTSEILATQVDEIRKTIANDMMQKTEVEQHKMHRLKTGIRGLCSGLCSIRQQKQRHMNIHWHLDVEKNPAQNSEYAVVIIVYTIHSGIQT